MTAWIDRPVEEARLFNPAFLLALLAAGIADYESTAEAPMPWQLSFLVPPLVLAERARQALPASTRAHFANWLDEHPEIRLGFARRAPALTPLTREGLRLGLRTGVLTLSEARLHAASNFRTAQSASDEVDDCLRCARLVGRWFASRHDVTTIFGLLGVTP